MLFDKVWEAHVIENLGEGWAQLHVDRHLLHDLTGPTALKDISDRGLGSGDIPYSQKMMVAASTMAAMKVWAKWS